MYAYNGAKYDANFIVQNIESGVIHLSSDFTLYCGPKGFLQLALQANAQELVDAFPDRLKDVSLLTLKLVASQTRLKAFNKGRPVKVAPETLTDKPLVIVIKCMYCMKLGSGQPLATVIQSANIPKRYHKGDFDHELIKHRDCLLYTSPSPRDATLSRMPSSA